VVPGIARLEGLFAGLPALVLAGGPSLDLLLPHLAVLAERMLVIAVNTPLKRCREAGVEPDFTVVVDPQYWASRFMDWAPLRGADGPTERAGGIIVAEPSTHPRVIRMHGAGVYFCSSLFPLGETLETAVGKKGRLGAGGSVATAAWDLARHLGASPIYTAGLDLGFPGMRTHCKGVFTEDLWLSSHGRLAPLEGTSFRYLREIGVFPVRSCSGGTTLTDRRMLIYKWWFENQLTLRPGTRTYALSPDGVAIEGMPLAEIGDVLSLPPIRAEIKTRKERERLSLAEGDSFEGARTALRETLGDLLHRLDELSILAEKGLQVNAALDAAIQHGNAAAPLLGELDALDARILDMSARSIAGFLMQSLIQRIDGKGERKSSPGEVLADSEALYRGIMDSARWQRDLISRAIDLLAGDPGLFSPKGSLPSADLLK
jgi:hypothetical protein